MKPRPERQICNSIGQGLSETPGPNLSAAADSTVYDVVLWASSGAITDKASESSDQNFAVGFDFRRFSHGQVRSGRHQAALTLLEYGSDCAWSGAQHRPLGQRVHPRCLRVFVEPETSTTFLKVRHL